MTAPSIAEETVLLDVLVEALPHLRGGLRHESALFTAQLLRERLRLDASAVVSRDEVLAWVGLGADHHRFGAPSLTTLTRQALQSGEVMRTHERAGIGCPHADCPLSSAVVAPLVVRGNVVGAIKLFHAPGRVIVDRDEKVARGLARLFSVYLELAELDSHAALVTRAELEALRAQISPHFLFNTLTTIAALTRTDAHRAHDLILDFAELFRSALTEHHEVVRLSEELRYVDRYVRVEKARFADRLTVEYDLEPNALDALVPVLALQTLVENALLHGIAPKNAPGHVCIRAREVDGGAFEISVVDDGVGIPEPCRERLLERGFGNGMGVGLNNVHQRLMGLFGPASGLRFASDERVGTRVFFQVPAEVTD